MSFAAVFVRPDPNTLGFYSETLGPHSAWRAVAFKLLDGAGAVQAFGSDWSVHRMVVLVGMHAAVTRTTAEGTPQDGWQPHLKISAEAALGHFTRTRVPVDKRGWVDPARLGVKYALGSLLEAITKPEGD